MSDLYYSFVIEYDGAILLCNFISEAEAKEWLWRILSRTTVESSRIVVQRVESVGYDATERMYGRPGDVNPLNGRKLFA